MARVYVRIRDLERGDELVDLTVAGTVRSVEQLTPTTTYRVRLTDGSYFFGDGARSVATTREAADA